VRWTWRNILSYFREEVVERSDSKINPGLQVWLAYGKLMLNSQNVNYSYGRLDTVFRSAFQQLKIGERPCKNVLLLGLGAGNVPKLLMEIAPEAKVLGIELDPEVLRLGRKYFGLDQLPNLEAKQADAIDFVLGCHDTFDMVVVDLFVDEEVPDRANDPAFLGKMAALLAPNGLLLFNRLGHTERLRQQSTDFGRKMRASLLGTIELEADTNRVFVYEKA
jgi:spermidine synthase